MSNVVPLMPSRLCGEADFAHGDSTWRLVLDMAAIDRFEGATNMSLQLLVAQMQNPGIVGVPRFGHVVRLLWAALMRHHGDTSIENAAALYHAGADVALSAALAAAFPAAAGDDDDDDDEAAADGDDPAGEPTPATT